MGESHEPVQYIGTGKPDVPPSGDHARSEHPAVSSVKNAIRGWWERVGPGSVEKAWVQAHEDILRNIKETEWRAAFERSAETWRKVGKTLGIASTAQDFMISGVGLFVAYVAFDPKYKGSWTRREILGPVFAATSAAAALVSGPAHIGARLDAKVVGLLGSAAARAENYVASERGQKNAQAAGEAAGKLLDIAAKNPDALPERLRKPVTALDALRKDAAGMKEARDQTRRAQEKAAREGLYQKWVTGMDPSLRSYYEQTTGWPPPLEEFIKVEHSFREDLQKETQAGKQDN